MKVNVRSSSMCLLKSFATPSMDALNGVCENKKLAFTVTKYIFSINQLEYDTFE